MEYIIKIATPIIINFFVNYILFYLLSYLKLPETVIILLISMSISIIYVFIDIINKRK